MSLKYKPASEPLNISVPPTTSHPSSERDISEDGSSANPNPETRILHPSSSFLLSSLELSDTKVYEPATRARLGTAAHFCITHHPSSLDRERHV